MCDACLKCSKIYDASQNLIVSRVANAKTGNPMFILVQEDEDNHYESVYVQVRFCPWCGEDLMKDSDASD